MRFLSCSVTSSPSSIASSFSWTIVFTTAKSIQSEVSKVEKTIVQEKLDAMDEGEEVTEQERKRIRAQAQRVANHVAQVISDHVRSGGGASELKEQSLKAQAEMIPEETPDDERKLSM